MLLLMNSRQICSTVMTCHYNHFKKHNSCEIIWKRLVNSVYSNLPFSLNDGNNCETVSPVCFCVLSVIYFVFKLSADWLLSPPELDSCRCVMFSISTQQNENSALTGETVWSVVVRRLSTRSNPTICKYSEKLTRCWHLRF